MGLTGSPLLILTVSPSSRPGMLSCCRRTFGALLFGELECSQNAGAEPPQQRVDSQRDHSPSTVISRNVSLIPGSRQG